MMPDPSSLADEKAQQDAAGQDAQPQGKPINQRLMRNLFGPGWRCSLARQYARNEHFASVDDTVKRLVKFHRQEEDEDRPAEGQGDFVLHVAFNLWRDDETRRKLILLVLGNVPQEKIARRFDTPPEVIEIIEKAFLDVRGSEAASWIHTRVIDPESHDASWSLRLKAAYWGGPAVAEAVVDSPEAMFAAESPVGKQVQHIENFELELLLKAREALQICLTDAKNAPKMVRIYNDHLIRHEKLQMEKERCRVQCEQAVEKGKLAQLRQEEAAELRELRDQQRRRRAENKEHQQQRRQQQQQESQYLHGQMAHQQRQAEKEAATQRAVNSPLAQLKWAARDVAPDGMPDEIKSDNADQERTAA